MIFVTSKKVGKEFSLFSLMWLEQQKPKQARKREWGSEGGKKEEKEKKTR